ncbi:MAG TPA: HAD family hydrolase [Candidatus Dormibacteraeota bacterium]|nr:HAD family hydrolase [Candidatus Dormibacteraeota bacterium]
MHFRVLACDYDNTLASHGVAPHAAVAALRSVAASGRRLVLVTGRVMDELLDVFNEIDVFDRVVAENGGTLYDPATGGHRLLGPPAPADLVAELRAAGVAPLVVGRVICATTEAAAPHVHDALHRLGVARELILNKGSLMVLPAGIDKASGLRAAVQDLGETLEATVAVGDAENDVVLLEVSGAGVAVANALDEVKERADLVLERSNGEGVRLLCQSLLEDDLAALLERAASPTV